MNSNVQRGIQESWNGFKDTGMDSRTLEWIQGYTNRFKNTEMDSRIHKWIQEHWNGFKIMDYLNGSSLWIMDYLYYFHMAAAGMRLQLLKPGEKLFRFSEKTILTVLKLLCLHRKPLHFLFMNFRDRSTFHST